jgi:hypothetical protein
MREHQHSSPGDPHGRRLAQKRAARLSEAGRVARVLRILAARADFPVDQIRILEKALAEREQVELMRAHGRVESRKRFKNAPTIPLLDGWAIGHIYVDESGVSMPESKNPPPHFFALGAVAVAPQDAENYCVAANKIKLEFFGRTDFSFHEPFMREHYHDMKNDVDYSFRGNRIRQAEFDTAITRLIENAKFLTFGVGINKPLIKRTLLTQAWTHIYQQISTHWPFSFF